MRALLLAAGLGTRLRPLTDTVPKCLVDINGRPLLDYWMEMLTESGIRDILVNLHYLPAAVESYLKQCRFPANIKTVFEEELLGTAGTVRKNLSWSSSQDLMLVHADNLSKFNMRDFMDCYLKRASGIEITMMTFLTDDPRSCGIVETDENGVVQAFHEKVPNPPGNLANAAVYILSPVVQGFIGAIDRKKIAFSTEILPHFLGRINTFQNLVYHRDIGSPEQLALARKEFPNRR